MAGTFEIYQDNAGEYRFRFKTENGENILASEGYKNKASAKNGTESVRKNAADDGRYERKETSSGKHIFNLRSGSGRVIGTSQSYASAAARDKGIEALKKFVSGAALFDLEHVAPHGTGHVAPATRSVAQEVNELGHPTNSTSLDLSSGLAEPQLSDNPQPNSNREETDAARRSGFGLHLTRESQEIVLNGKSFALALARLFKNAEGEFSFALLGRWGSGKTAIASHVSDYLKTPSSYRSDFRNAFGSDPDEECDQLEYKAVQFNAWRYRQKPELWVYLYESFLAEFLNCNLLERILKTVRFNMRKVGVLQSLVVLLLLAFTAFPSMWVFQVFPHAQKVFGIAGLVGLALLAYRWNTSLRRLYDQYGVIKSHRDHLGMQAVIGLDLQLLVASWSKTDDFRPWEKWGLSISVLAVSLYWFLALWTVETGNTILPTISVAASFSWPSMAGWVIWSLVSAVFVVSINFKTGSVDRILLVVDDLDRCPQEEIVDLIDGIKLMIDDETVGNVVQALVLADDTVLNAAVRNRFNNLSDDEDDARRIEAISEHMEKVFLCHAHLPKLTQSNVAELVSHFSKEFGLENLQSEEDEPALSFVSPGAVANDFQLDETLPELKIDFVISAEERVVIQRVLSDAFEKAKFPMTPRFVRSFLFKFQLVRMLLQLNAVGYETYDLVHSLAQATLWARSSDKPWEPQVASNATSYIRMVA